MTQRTTDEIPALFLSSIGEPLRDYGLSDALRGAQLKRTAARAESRRATRSLVAGRMRRSDVLSTLHRAVMEDLRVHVRLARPYNVMTERTIEPHGLVASDGEWFVVWIGGDGRARVDRLSAVRAAAVTEDRFERDADLDLGAFRTERRRRRQAARRGGEAMLRVREDAVP